MNIAMPKNLVLDDDVTKVLMIYDDLMDLEKSAQAIEVIENYADHNNTFACYVLGSLYLFGKPPRHYDFNRKYDAGTIKQNALIPINEKKGLAYYVRLLSFESELVQNYHLEGIFDLFRIVKGDAPLFDGNDLQCRPVDESNTLVALFSSADNILEILDDFNYYEAYVDQALSCLEQYSKTSSEAFLTKAIGHLKSVINGSSNPFCQYDIVRAHTELAKIYLYGNTHVKPDHKKATSLIGKAKSDLGFLMLLDFYENSKHENIDDIQFALSRIVDDQIRYDQRLRFNMPYPVSPKERIEKLWTLLGIKTPLMGDQSVIERPKSNSQTTAQADEQEDALPDDKDFAKIEAENEARMAQETEELKEQIQNSSNPFTFHETTEEEQALMENKPVEEQQIGNEMDDFDDDFDDDPYGDFDE